jgi:hypothetical protein
MPFYLIYDPHDDTFTMSFFPTYMLFASSSMESLGERERREKTTSLWGMSYMPAGKNSRQSNWVSVQTRFLGFMIFFYATWLNATLTPVLVLDSIG